MTTLAADGRVFAAEWKLGGCMVEGLRHPFPPALFVVAGFARSARLALRKLPGVRIRVTVGASEKLYNVEPVAPGRRPPGIALPMTLPAWDLSMLAAKRKTGRCVVEILPCSLPRRSRMAALARFFELAPVRIGVT
jgi:hypothetical protein